MDAAEASAGVLLGRLLARTGSVAGAGRVVGLAELSLFRGRPLFLTPASVVDGETVVAAADAMASCLVRAICQEQVTLMCFLSLNSKAKTKRTKRIKKLSTSFSWGVIGVTAE